MGAFYVNSVSKFLQDSNQHIIGSLTSQASTVGFHQQLHSQTSSWDKEITILKETFNDLIKKDNRAKDWGILLEYPIARRAKRIDAILITNSLIIVIEFKVNSNTFHSSDKEQLLDYCLDIRDFHFQSKNQTLIPLLVATEASAVDNSFNIGNELIQPMLFANKHSLLEVLKDISALDTSTKNAQYIEWDNSSYAPTPTIIEAAQTLFAGKAVEEISRSHAGTKNLTKTTDAVINAVRQAKERNEKVICFITGVPGAGKTLAGLNIAHHPEFQFDDQSLATFLSGNGPLIKVLRRALSNDAYKRLSKDDKTVKKKEQERIVAFIENVHRFIDEYFFEKQKVPNNRVVIFDEAQRAWNAEHSKRKFNRDFSEPEMMFDIMSRHDGWSVIVALIGGGQEINTGEAGLREWGNNIINKFNNWKVYISPELKEGDHSTGNLTLFENIPENIDVKEEKDLHLEVALRSYKAENLSSWVHLVLANQPIDAKMLLEASLQDYPLVITRNLDAAKKWLSSMCKGSRRMGLVASSGGRRLRPYGLDVKAELEEEHWFLDKRGDVRASYALELPATEFGIQGLELDWVGACWDADLRRNNEEWDFTKFSGSTWKSVNKKDTRQYILNKYRVLLTRAREGMVIFVPEGDNNDATRLPEFYNPIYEYLKSCGVQELINLP